MGYFFAAFIKRLAFPRLCIPAVFYFLYRSALDKKTPLLRSLSSLEQRRHGYAEALGAKNVKKVYSNLGPEQEYFLIDMDYYYKRRSHVYKQQDGGGGSSG